jgi:hypothetical protein
MITRGVQDPRIILIATELKRNRPSIRSWRIRRTAHLREGRHRRILRVGVDELEEAVRLGGVVASIRPDVTGAFPGRRSPEGSVVVGVGVLAIE